MLLNQHDLGCLAHASYLIAHEATGTAVVDPQHHIDQYLADAQAHGWQIRYVFLTHSHTLVTTEQPEAPPTLPC